MKRQEQKRSSESNITKDFLYYYYYCEYLIIIHGNNVWKFNRNGNVTLIDLNLYNKLDELRLVAIHVYVLTLITLACVNQHQRILGFIVK